jgi:glycosyltransferase involved in cell wall biosynthesis
MMTGTVGLMMIVKNEEKTLPRLAASLRGQIDHWTIVDTGSTDATREVVPELFHGVGGELAEVPWEGFAPARNAALRAARPHTDWLLTLDADDTLDGDVRRAVAGQDADCIEAELDYMELSYWVPRIVRAAADWEWRGRAHEYLALRSGSPRMARTRAVRVHHHADGGSRSEKFERELALLRKDFEETPDDPRTVFYLARVLEDGGELREAGDLYRRRLGLGGWDEEVWYARWRFGVCLLNSGRQAEAIGVLFDAWGERPWRAEPLWTLAEHYRANGKWQQCWEAGNIARRHTAARPDGSATRTSDRLFVHSDVYDWRMAYERSIAAYYVGDHPTGRRLCEYLMTRQLPPAIRESVEGNMTYFRA